ncbi:uncharacterized protein NECHADRAFT_88422 [Fusarium vanettenii 77-13-4]|uniref:F-box domain-containing protein n=1 Tax=Fusarium vanettenii (strain ATCC MYA-4622 / CBS 123669 / FGSC 9596 / NRRL 45880 / 77-13-4) TaxID=660122 RepID=C7ZMD6_FUSV7|nr:uncharacterized protein NECHADRAFT_88422 [Fusarium vanettenii 77-13-4]EEU34836.1 predicted protein [Fusarium vanettenii 77-13-4]
MNGIVPVLQADLLSLQSIAHDTQEVLSEILRKVDTISLKACRLVCKYWNCTASELLFRQIVIGEEGSQHFMELFSHKRLCGCVRAITFEQSDPLVTATDLLQLDFALTDLNEERRQMDPELGKSMPQEQFRGLPKVGLVCQGDDGKFSSILECVNDPKAPPILSALREIRLITDEAPDFPMTAFHNLTKINIDIETIKLPSELKWWALTDVSLRGSIDIDNLEAFLKYHHCVEKLRIVAVLRLGLVEISRSQIHTRLRVGLGSIIGMKAIDSAMKHAQKRPGVLERDLLGRIRGGLAKRPDSSVIEQAHQAIVATYAGHLESERERFVTNINEMRESLGGRARPEINVSMEYVKEDKLAIQGGMLEKFG